MIGAVQAWRTERHAKGCSRAHEEGPHDVSPHPTQEVAVRSADLGVLRLGSRCPRVWERRVSVSPSIVVITLPRFPVHSPRTPFGLRGDNLRTVTPETLFYKPKGISPTVPRYTVTPHLVDREPSVSMVDHVLPEQDTRLYFAAVLRHHTAFYWS